MRQFRAHSGARPVGRFEDLTPVQSGALYYMRLEHASRENRVRLERQLVPVFGLNYASQLAAAFHQFYDTSCHYGRRAFMYHSPGCDCLGADEACFCALVAYALEGRREDAALMASLIVRADYAFALAEHAQTIGCAFERVVKCKHDIPPWPQASEQQAYAH